MLLVAVWAGFAGAQTLAHKGWAGSGITVEPWWKSAEFYQIDPISFQDSDGDGFGDLKGIEARLDYLQSLGVDALVLSPFQTSAGSGGASDRHFDPHYGSSEDFDHLALELGRRRMRLVVDLRVSAQLPEEELLAQARFWLSRGVAGLQLKPEPGQPEIAAARVAEQVRAVRRVVASYGGERVLISDAPAAAERGSTAASSSKVRHGSGRGHAPGVHGTYAGPAGVAGADRLERLQLEIDRRPGFLGSLDASSLRGALVAEAQTVTSWPVLVTDADDRPRSVDRYGDGHHDAAIAKMMATLLLTSRGSPMLFFGQEVGMATTPAAPQAKGGGDPAPMQWGTAQGFSAGSPGIEMGPNAATANVEAEDADPESLLNWYRRLGVLRHGSAALREGSMNVLAAANPTVVAWVRRAPGRADSATLPPVLVVANLSGQAVAVSLTEELRRAGVTAGPLRTLALSSRETHPPDSAASIVLPAWGVYVGEVRSHAGLESEPAPVIRRRSSRSAARTSSRSSRSGA